MLPFNPMLQRPPGLPGQMPPLPGSAVALPPSLGSSANPLPMTIPGGPNPMAGALGMQPPAPGMGMGGMPGMMPPGMGGGMGMPPPGGPMGGMGMPPMPPMGGALGPMQQPPAPPPPPPTLMQMGQDADMMAMLEQLMDQFERSQGDDGPIYPPGFKRPKKPDADATLALVEMDRRAQHERNEQIDFDLDVTRGEIVGMFREDKERWFYEPFKSTQLKNEIANGVNFCSSVPKTFEMTAKDISKRQEAQDCEDAVYWCWDEIADQWSVSGPGDVKRDQATHAAQTGWIAARFTPNPTMDTTFQFIYRLFDIRCIFPKWDGHRGLERVSVVYQDTLSAVLADFDDQSGKIRKALDRQYNDDEFNDPTLMVAVTEVWDRWWRGVYVGDTLVVPFTAHKYGFVPFSVVPCGGGDSASSSTPITTSVAGNGYQHNHADWSRHTKRYQSTSLIRDMIEPFMQQQKIMGKQMTRIRHADNPALNVKQTIAAQRLGIRPQDITPGAVNTLLMNEEEAEPFLPAIPTDSMAPVLATINRDMMASSTPGSMMGQVDKSNVTGVAMESMNEAGARRYTPIINGMDMHYKQIAQMFLRYVQNMGKLLGEDGTRGELMLPRRRPQRGENPAYTLTQDTVRAVFGKSYPRVKVRSDSTTKQQKIALMNMYQMGIKGNIFSERWARDDFGIENPDAMGGEIKREQAMNEPDIQKVLMFDALENAGEAKVAQLFRQFVLEKPSESAADGQPPPGGTPSGGPSGISSQGGVSMPMQGIPSGQAGGRPPGMPPGLPMGL